MPWDTLFPTADDYNIVFECRKTFQRIECHPVSSGQWLVSLDGGRHMRAIYLDPCKAYCGIVEKWYSSPDSTTRLPQESTVFEGGIRLPQGQDLFGDSDAWPLTLGLDLEERTVLEAEVLMWRLWTASR